jgi:hypothetical protein
VKPPSSERIALPVLCSAYCPRRFSSSALNDIQLVRDGSLAHLEHFRFWCMQNDQTHCGFFRWSRFLWVLAELTGVNAAFPLRKAALQETEWDIAMEIRSKKSLSAVSAGSEML